MRHYPPHIGMLQYTKYFVTVDAAYGLRVPPMTSFLHVHSLVETWMMFVDVVWAWTLMWVEEAQIFGDQHNEKCSELDAIFLELLFAIPSWIQGLLYFVAHC